MRLKSEVRGQASKIAAVEGLLEKILQDGGEGVILRLSNSAYTRGRSTELLKLKVL